MFFVLSTMEKILCGTAAPDFPEEKGKNIFLLLRLFVSVTTYFAAFKRTYLYHYVYVYHTILQLIEWRKLFKTNRHASLNDGGGDKISAFQPQTAAWLAQW